MKTIIAGTRTATITAVVMAIVQCPWSEEITEVVHGGAPGADRWGKRWANSRKLPITEYPADWKQHGRAAGPIRNGEMANYADALVLVWDGKSRGSRDMLEKAQAKGLRVFVWDYEKGEVVDAD